MKLKDYLSMSKVKTLKVNKFTALFFLSTDKQCTKVVKTKFWWGIFPRKDRML